ncbi:MAG: ROK family protein [Oscillospiraceae bacterium]|nr:ROK family protein [Oscillospiraceae bacterium]
MYVGVDLGGSKIAAAIVDDNGKILTRVHYPTKAGGGSEAIVSGIIEACTVLLRDSDNRVRSIGIGVPGAVREDTGTVVFTPNLPLMNVDMTSKMRSMFNIPVRLGNDANCAVLGETIAGSAKGSKDVAMITLGTGLGGGIVVDGKLLTGLSGGAGEVGHMITVVGGRKCGCGRRGCWETYASASGLVRTALGHMEKHPESLMWDLCVGLTERVDGRTVFDAYRTDDPAALLTVGEYVEHLAIGIVNMINILEPEIFSIGGGVSNAWDCMEEPLNAAVELEKFVRFSEDAPKTKIVKARLGNDAGIIGAAMLGREWVN